MGPTTERSIQYIPSSAIYTDHGRTTHKMPPEPEFLGEQPVFKPKGSDEIPTVRKESEIPTVE